MRRIALSFVLLCLFPGVSFPAPMINFDSVSHDFGLIGQEEKAEHVFVFSNKGDQDLIVEKVTGS